MVADDQILFAFPEHGGGHVRFVGILVDAFELAVLVGVGYRAQAVLVDQAVLQLAVFLFADSSVEWVNQIFDCAAVWQTDCSQVAQAVVVVAGGALGDGMRVSISDYWTRTCHCERPFHSYQVPLRYE